jgi:hypothetical protein
MKPFQIFFPPTFENEENVFSNRPQKHILYSFTSIMKATKFLKGIKLEL